MDILQSKVLQIFREFKTPVDGILNPQSIQSKIRNWDRRSQDNSLVAINELKSNGYIGTKDNWFTLTQKGYNFLYEGFSIEDTENIILEFLRKRNLGVGHVIMKNWFTSFTTEIERYHFDNFNEAFSNIIEKEYIEVRQNGLFFTQKGYDKVY